jgi:hypothetical protein
MGRVVFVFLFCLQPSRNGKCSYFDPKSRQLFRAMYIHLKTSDPIIFGTVWAYSVLYGKVATSSLSTKVWNCNRACPPRKATWDWEKFEVAALYVHTRQTDSKRTVQPTLLDWNA